MPPSDAAPVLVTGAAGFIGSQLTRALVARGVEVIALDADPDQGRLSGPLSGVTHVAGDVRDEALVERLVSSCARVFHFAAIAGVHEYMARTLDVLDVNLLGTRNVLMAAARARVPVLFASSSEAYGKNTALLDEDADTHLGPSTHARWCYATTKIAGEHYAWALARQGLPVAAVRYFNVYGPTLDEPGRGRVLSQFLGRIQEGLPLELVGGGRAVRCLCYIDDAIDATLRLGMALQPGSPLVGRPYNVGNPEPVTMRELAGLVVRLADHAPGTVDVDGETFFGPGFEEIPHRVPDVSALEDAIGFRAAMPLEEGVRRVLAHWGLLAATPRPASPSPIPVIRPVYDADDALLQRYRRALDAGRTTNAGPEVTGLEAELGAWLGADELLAVSSGAAAIEVALRALGPRGKAILPSFTYVATLNAVEQMGLEPVFCDVDPTTWTMAPQHLATLLARHKQVGVVLPVCAYGVPPDLDGLLALTASAGIPIVYDAAHAVGTTVRGARYDARVTATAYSLHATKVLPGTEAGALAIPDPALRARAATVRAHGLPGDPFDAIVGQNAKLDELSAATARHGLARIDGILARRRAYGDRLQAALTAGRWTPQQVPPGVVTNRQNLCARIPRGQSLDAVIARLDAQGIGTRRYFHPPLHLLRRLAPAPALPVTEAVWATLLCLPLYSRMDEPTLHRLEDAFASVGR